MLRRLITLAVGAVVTIALVVGGMVAVDWSRKRLPGDLWELDEACAGKAYTNAAPYQGAGPHPVLVFKDDGDGLSRTTVYRTERIVWEPTDPPDTEAVQLVACVTLSSTDTPRDTGCAYSSSPSLPGGVTPMARAVYRIRVYELRTQQEVLSTLATGEDEKCPSMVVAGRNQDDRLLSDLTFTQWQQLLGDLVNRNR